MKKFLFGMSGAALIALAAGCGPKLAQVATGADELEWKEFAAENYSGYRPPRVTSPAEKDKYQGEVNLSGAAAEPAPPAEEPAAVAEEKRTETAPAVTEETPADKEETAPAAKVEEAAPAEKTEEAAPAAKEEKTAPEAAAETAPVNGEEYVVKSGDTLSGLAKKFYKDGNLSGIIFKANSNVLKDPNALRPGMKLIIPKM
ncbi:MAG: LysM peptidoglycan-binding domain-containing protein [Lentisphaeria bacterium]|nr:LysM peptidoglycan-binding domain-containing protein [Lentisphaeria bacterium]